METEERNQSWSELADEQGEAEEVAAGKVCHGCGRAVGYIGQQSEDRWYRCEGCELEQTESELVAEALPEVETYYEHGRTYPSVNVKVYRTWQDVIADQRRAWAEDKCNPLDLADDGPAFLDWLESALWEDDQCQSLDTWHQAACEQGWEDAADEAKELFGITTCYSAGRSGGHLIVAGIGTPEDWARCVHCGDQKNDHDDDYCGSSWTPDRESFAKWATFATWAEDRARYVADEGVMLVYLNLWETKEGEVPEWVGPVHRSGYWS